MFDPKVQKQSKPKNAVGPNSSAVNVAIKAETVPAQNRIRERAYDLYESRGREPGQDEQDWFRAEQEILKR
jgi:hypothetical protein